MLSEEFTIDMVVNLLAILASVLGSFLVLRNTIRKEVEGRLNEKKWEVYTATLDWVIAFRHSLSNPGLATAVNQQIIEVFGHLILVGSKSVIKHGLELRKFISETTKKAMQGEIDHESLEVNLQLFYEFREKTRLLLNAMREDLRYDTEKLDKESIKLIFSILGE